jgi:hypothetical protein
VISDMPTCSHACKLRAGAQRESDAVLYSSMSVFAGLLRQLSRFIRNFTGMSKVTTEVVAVLWCLVDGSDLPSFEGRHARALILAIERPPEGGTCSTSQVHACRACGVGVKLKRQPSSRRRCSLCKPVLQSHLPRPEWMGRPMRMCWLMSRELCHDELKLDAGGCAKNYFWLQAQSVKPRAIGRRPRSAAKKGRNREMETGFWLD